MNKFLGTKIRTNLSVRFHIISEAIRLLFLQYYTPKLQPEHNSGDSVMSELERKTAKLIDFFYLKSATRVSEIYITGILNKWCMTSRGKLLYNVPQIPSRINQYASGMYYSTINGAK